MDKKLEFNEALASLIELAANNDNKLTTGQIDSAFDGILDNHAMLEHVYEYLVENKISVVGYISPLSEAEEDKSVKGNAEAAEEYNEPASEQNYINMYLEELSDIIPVSSEEEEELIRLALEGHTPSRDRLVELNLGLVIEIINDYKGQGVHTSDLIQEGNMGLICAVAAYDGQADQDSFHSHLTSYIHDALKAAVNEEIGADRIGRHLADRANALDNFSTEFAREHEREATLEELAEGMGLPEDEVRNILKYSLDALNSTGEEE